MGKKSFKPLYESLTELCDRKPRPPPYVMFMAAKEEIEKALADGWRVSEIWEAMKNEGRIQCVYGTFARYVREYVRKRREDGVHDNDNKPKQSALPNGATVTPQGRVMPDWPKPGSAQSSGPKLAPSTYRGEMPVYGSKPKPEDFNKF